MLCYVTRVLKKGEKKTSCFEASNELRRASNKSRVTPLSLCSAQVNRSREKQKEKQKKLKIQDTMDMVSGFYSFIK
jgi:hypothetical protein